MLSNWKNIIKIKFGSLSLQSKSLRFILIVFIVFFIIFYVIVSLKDMGTLDFNYIFSYWVESFSLKKITVFIKRIQVVRLFSVLLNVFLVLVVFLRVKNQLRIFFNRIWRHVISLFIFITKRFLDILKIDSIYWLSIIPVLYILSYITKVHSIPNNDYWNLFFLPVLNTENLLDFIKSLFITFNNEHLIFLPKLIFLVHLIVTKGDNRYLFLINVAINLISLMLFIKLFSKEKAFPKRYLWLLYIIVSLMFFSPNMSHNWVRSMSGVMWFLANMFFVASLVSARLALKYKDKSKKYFILVSLFTVLAFLTYSSSLSLPVVVAFYLLLNIDSWKNRRKFYVLYFILFLAIYLYWFLFWYKKPAIHPDLSFKIFDNINFIKVYIGSGFSGDLKIVKGYGEFGITMFIISTALVFVLFLKNRVSKSFPILSMFYSISLYAFINVILTVISRSGDKEIYNIMYIERYINITNLFWLGTILFIFYFMLLTVVNYKKQITSKCVNIFIVFISIFIFFPMYTFGSMNMRSMMDVFNRAEKPFKLAVSTGVYDSDVFRTFMTWGDLSIFNGIINTPLYQIYHPFNVNNLIFSYKNKMNGSENYLKKTYKGEVLGALDTIKVLNKEDESINIYYDNEEYLRKVKDKPKDYKITGWACLLDEKIRNMLILDDSNRMFGAGLVFDERADINALYGEKCLVSGFVAYIREAVPGQRYSIFLIDRNSKNYYFQDVTIPIE